ncbi:hypothetical protein FDZ73_19335 [bacterium]|nr:MAG: hypothetical protein FDZ73_19335 [bacterium]
MASTYTAPVGSGLTGMLEYDEPEDMTSPSQEAIEAAKRDREILAHLVEAGESKEEQKALTWEEYQALPKHERGRLVVGRGVVMDPSKIPEGVKKLVVNRNGRAYLLIGDQVDEYLAGKKAYFDGKSRESKKKKNKRKASKLARKRNR